MKKRTMRKVISLMLAVLMTLSLLLSATASTMVGDINGDGKVSVFDAQMLLEAQKGLRQLTEAQQTAAGKLSIQDILRMIFGTYVDESVQVGDVYKFTELAGERNGENGLTFYYSADGTTLTPYSLYDSNAACWYETPDNWKVSAVYPSVVPADNYGAGKSYTGTSVVMGFEAPATGTVDLYSWTVLQSDCDYRVSIAKGTADNVLYTYDVSGDNQQAVVNTYSIYLTEGQQLYLIYTPTESADYIPFGYITSVTYTELGGEEPPTEPSEPEPTEPEDVVQVGDTFLSAVLAPTAANGEKGMTYYYTADGKTLTPFAAYDPGNHSGRWYNMDTATRSFVDPFVIPADNYGWIGASASAYVVVGYEMPADGQITLTNWIALHTGHDCRLMIAKGNVENTVDVTDVIGAADTVAEQAVTLGVSEGEMIYVIYQPLETAETADTCYYGYKTQYTYLSVGEVPAATTQDTAAVSAALKNRTDAVAAAAGLAALDYDVQLKPVGTRAQVYTSASYTDGVATFTYTDGQTSVDYVIDTAWDKIKTGLVEVQTRRNGGNLIQAVTNAGTGYRNRYGTVMTPTAYAAAASVTMTPSFDAATGTLTLHYRETYQNVTNEKTYTICLDQKSLVIHVTSNSTNGKNGYADFRTGRSAGITNPTINNSVYVEEVSVTEIDNTYFLSAYIDKAKTFSTKVTNAPSAYSSGTDHGLTANYELNSAGGTNPLNEIFYVTVSDEFLDCVYLTNGEKSAYRDTLNNLIVYDNWEFTSSYTQRKNTYLDLALSYGITDVILVEHRWQRDTLDISNPAHYPASTEWGTAAEFADYIETVKQTLGWTLALHEDYWFMYPSAANQYWNVANVNSLLAQNADGSLRYGWQSSYANKSDMMVVYARQESSQIESAYDPGASFIDVNGGVDPSDMNQVTLNANSTTSRTLAQVVSDTVKLIRNQQDTYGGPVITEGAQGERSFGSAYAGYLESNSREITDRNTCRIMPDYELTYIRPLMVNQGMGPLARFQLNKASNTYDFDKYNTTCIAYGHTGFIGDVHYTLPLRQEQMINTYYMFRALQPQYLDSSVTVEEILYYTASGTAMDLNAAVKTDYDFTAPRLYIRYSNGLELYLNFMDANWEVTLNGNSYTLDKNGYCAENPNLGFIQYSCLRGGVRVDYVKSREYTYANPRGNLVDFGDGLKGNLLMLRSDELDLNVKNTTQSASIKFADLAYYGNGTKGLTFYYTSDGQTLNKFSNYDGNTGRFYHTVNGTLKSFVDPREIVSANYGTAQTSADEYVVMTYKAPSTGTIELYVWTANQNGAGYEISTAIGSVNNVISSYQATAVGEGAVDILTLTVTEGEMIYLIYKPINGAAGDWFGYTTQVTYLYAES